MDQDIAPGAGARLVFQPISQYDSAQYTDTALPGFAPLAAETTIATMVARALTNTSGMPKVDQLWADNRADWARVEGVSLTDEPGASRSLAQGQTAGISNGSLDVAAMLARGPVIIGGEKQGDAPQLLLLAISMTADGKGIVANDPGTGQQVILGYDAATGMVGDVTSVIDPRSQQTVPLGDGRPDLGPEAVQVPLQAWSALKTFKPTTFAQLAIKR